MRESWNDTSSEQRNLVTRTQTKTVEWGQQTARRSGKTTQNNVARREWNVNSGTAIANQRLQNRLQNNEHKIQTVNARGLHSYLISKIGEGWYKGHWQQQRGSERTKVDGRLRTLQLLNRWVQWKKRTEGRLAVTTRRRTRGGGQLTAMTNRRKEGTNKRVRVRGSKQTRKGGQADCISATNVFVR